MSGCRLAAQFEKQFDQHPDRECLVFGDRRPTYAQVMAARIGAVIVPLNPSLSCHELKYQLRRAQIGLCVIPQEHDGVDYREALAQIVGVETSEK